MVPRRRLRSGLLAVTACVLAAASTALRGARAQAEPTRTLEPASRIERDLAGGGADAYELPLDANQYVRLTVDQIGIELIVLRLVAPDGKTLATYPRLPSGPTMFSLVSETSGRYRVEVRSLDKNSTGRYALRIEDWRAATDGDGRRVAAERLFIDAERLRTQGTAASLRAALEKYEAALPLYRSAGDRYGEANAVMSAGRARDGLGDKPQAIAQYAAALEMYGTLSDRIREAYVLNFSALAYDFLGEKRKALDTLERALPVARVSGDRRIEGTTLNNFGMLYYNLGEKQKALEYYGQALAFQRQINNRGGEASTLTGIGTVYDSIGEKRTALEYMMQALPLRRLVGDRGDEAATLNNIGAVYITLGEYPQALDYLNQALPPWRAAGNRMGEGSSLNNVARVHEARGEYQSALDAYRQALELHRAAGYPFGEANALTNVGLVLMSLGDPKNALASFTQALPLHRAVKNRGGEAAALAGIGAAHAQQGDTALALEYYEQSLPLARAVGDRNGEAATLGSLARVYVSRHEYERALATYQQALALHRAVGSRRGEASTLADLGAVHAARGATDTAAATFTDALPIARAIGDRGTEARILHQLARTDRDRGDLAGARAHAGAALAIAESLRSTVFNQELRSSYLASVQDYYRLAIDVLARSHTAEPAAGYDAAALQTSERARARGLLDLLTEAGADIRQGVDSALVQRERAAQQWLDAKAARLTRVLNAPHTDAQAAEASRDVDAATNDYRQIEADIRATSPRYAALVQPQPLGLDEIRAQVLDAGTLLLEYALGEEHSRVFAVSSTSFESYELPGRTQIEDASRRFYDAIKTDADPARSREAASALGRMLVGPVAGALGAKRLVIVADGALQYVPFGALPDPAAPEQRLLIAAHEIVSLPSASALAVLRRETAGRRPPPKTLAVIADPVFTLDDQRVTPPGARGPEGLPRLIGSRREATAILALVPEAMRKRALDFDASRTTATSAELGQYGIVHFATHAILDSVHPELSGVVLSLVDARGRPQDGFLRLHEVFNLKLPVNLVVLSACQTALGREIRGEGLIGLTRGFMYAGARGVVASLWQVDDESTAELMKRFYRAMLKEGRRPADALRTAQLELSRHPRWSAPFYWAGFVLQGEWR